MPDNEKNDQKIRELENTLKTVLKEQEALKETAKKVEKWESYGRAIMWVIILIVGIISQADKVISTLKKWLV